MMTNLTNLLHPITSSLWAWAAVALLAALAALATFAGSSWAGIGLASLAGWIGWRIPRGEGGLRWLGGAALAMILLGGTLLALPANAADRDEARGHAWVEAAAWEDATTGQRWLELVPLAPLMIEVLGPEPIWASFVPATSEAIWSSQPLLPPADAQVEVLAVDLAMLNALLGDIVYAHLSSASTASECEILCYDLRKSSPQYQGLLDAEEIAGMNETVGGGLLAIGAGLASWAMAGGIIKATAAGAITVAGGVLAGVALVAGAVLLAGGLVTIQSVTDQAVSTAEAWANNPANGCPGCGYALTGTVGWTYDAGSDVCYDPGCAGGPSPEQEEGEGGGSSGGSGGDGIDMDSLEIADLTESQEWDSSTPTYAGAGGGDAGSVGVPECDGFFASYSGPSCEAVSACDELPEGTDWDDVICAECWDSDGDTLWSTCEGGDEEPLTQQGL